MKKKNVTELLHVNVVLHAIPLCKVYFYNQMTIKMVKNTLVEDGFKQEKM